MNLINQRNSMNKTKKLPKIKNDCSELILKKNETGLTTKNPVIKYLIFVFKTLFKVYHYL